MKLYRETFSGERYFANDLFIFVNRHEENFEKPHHFHDFVEITIVEEGKGFHYINDEVLPVSKGDIFLLPIGISHVFRPASTNAHLIVYNVIFDISVLKKLVDIAMSHGEQAFSIWCSQLADNNTEFLHLVDKYDAILTLLRSMFMEFQAKQTGYTIVLHARLQELLISLFRLEHQFIPNTDSKVSSFAINEVIAYMHQHLQEPITLAQMAQTIKISQSHFVREFKKYTNQTFVEYLQNMRIEKSCHLLTYTDLPIKEICQMIGYTNVDYFRELFLKITGSLPKEYRKTRNQNELK